MIRLKLASLITLLLPLFSLLAQPLLHQPALSPDGEMIAFSYQGDIWAVGADGGSAKRLTIHESYEGAPVWSPDGKRIAFVGNRYGNYDVFVTSPEGGLPQRITHHSASDYQVSWLDNKGLLFSTRRLFAQVERGSEFYQAGLNGGTPTRFLDAIGNEAVASPDGRYLAFVRGGCKVSREAYRGPANRDIWLYDRQADTYTQITTDEGQDYNPLWDNDGNLYFLSARSGRYNLYRTEARAGAEKEALTRFKDWGIRFYGLNASGDRVVIERGDKIELSTNGGKSFKPVSIQVVDDFKFYPVEERTLTSGLSDFALSPNGKYVALGNRGEIFVKPNDKEKGRSRNVTDHPYQDQGAEWLNDSTLLMISDRGPVNGTTIPAPALLLCQSADTDQPNLFLSFEFETQELLRPEEGVSSFVLSPDHSQIAVTEGRGKLHVFDIDSVGNLSNQRILADGWDTPGGVSWSPDGKYLAYNLSDLNFNEEVYIHAADNSSPRVNISMHPRGDYGPVWSPDGSKLGFQSIRNNGDQDIWFVWLKREDYEKTQRDWEEADEWEVDESKKKKSDTVVVEIDFEDIHERLVQVTSLPGSEGDLVIGQEGDWFYFSTNNGSRAGSEGDSDLMKIKWDGSEMSTLLPKTNPFRLTLSKDGKSLYFLNRGRLTSTPVAKGRATSQPFSGKMTLDHVAERRHLIEGGWSALNAGFYDPDFHGRDWEELKEKYTPLMLRASTRQNFSTLYNEMLGQLDASHMGYGSFVQDEDVQRDRTGYLGAEVDGNRRIVRIVPNSPADRSESQLEIGDRILAVNGESISSSDNMYTYLNGKANERTQLTIERGGEEIDVLIRPATSMRTANYEAWVDLQKEMTDRYSNGRLGYIHIRGMNWPSFERFERELTAAGLGKEGIVIDVRFNGGGWTTDMLMAVLNVRQHSYTIPRGAASSLKQNQNFANNYPYGERLPLAAMTLPSIALCNEASYSNAEIFSHAYKHLGHGTLVGQPTFGAVISTGSARLIDGSYVRMPFRAWYVKATGENMEGGPAVPDIVVENTPNGKAKGEDAQLKAAVDELLKQLK